MRVAPQRAGSRSAAMPQRRPPGSDKGDPGQPLREESEKERREEEGGAPADEAQRQRGSQSDGHEPQESGKTDPLRGRPPSHEPDVFVDVPKAHVDEIYLDVEAWMRTCRCGPNWPISFSSWRASTCTAPRSSSTSRG